EESEVESEIVRNVEDPDVCVDDSEVESPKSRQQMSVKRKKMSLEDNLLQMLEGRKVEDPVSSFLMSLAPQIRKLCQEKQNQIFIEFLQAIQRVSSTNPNQSTHIPPTNNNVYSLPIQHPTSTFYDCSYNTYPTAINHHPNQLDITPASSSLTSSGLDTNQSVSAVVCAANPHQYFNYYTNLSQTVTAPGSPSTIPLFKTEED
ncbi:BESS domain-containing protein, partial [Aphis craccivora]